MSKSAPGDVRLLLDENISPNIVSRLWEIGIDTGSRDEQYGYVVAIVAFLQKAPRAMHAARNHIVSFDVNFGVTARFVCASLPPKSSTVKPTQS